MTFAAPELLLRACSSSRSRSARTSSSSAGAAATWSGSRTSTCSPTSCRGRPAWRRHVPPALYLGAIAALVVALARPSMVARGPARGGDDHPDDGRLAARCRRPTSSRPGSRPPRRPRSDFVDQLPAAFQVGLVAFSTDARLVVAPTTDRGQVHAAIDNLGADGGTALGDAIALSLERPPTPAASVRDRPPAPPTPSPAASASQRPTPSASPARPHRPTRRPPATGRRSSRRSSCPTAPTRPARLEPLRRGRQDAAAAGHADLHDRPRHGRRRRRGPGPVRPDAAAPGPAGHARRCGGRRDDRRQVLRRPDGRGPRRRSTRASARRSATPSRSRRSPSRSPRPACCSSSPAAGSPPSGSTASPDSRPGGSSPARSPVTLADLPVRTGG